MAMADTVECPPGVYTLISDGNDKVELRCRHTPGGRLAMGPTQPPPLAGNYVDYRVGQVYRLTGLGSTKLWYMPNDNYPQEVGLLFGVDRP